MREISKFPTLNHDRQKSTSFHNDVRSFQLCFFTIGSGKFCKDVADMKTQTHEAIGDSAFLFFIIAV